MNGWVKFRRWVEVPVSYCYLLGPKISIWNSYGVIWSSDVESWIVLMFLNDDFLLSDPARCPGRRPSYLDQGVNQGAKS